MIENSNNKENIIYYILLFLSVVILWMPNSYSYILPSSLYSLMRWAQYLTALMAVILVVISNKINKIFVMNIILSLILIFSTIINSGNINKCLNYVSPMLGTVSLIIYCIGVGHEKRLLQVLRHVLLLYILINIASYFLFPNGIYITELVTRLDERKNTFLGNRNAYKYYGLFIILVSFIETTLYADYKQKNTIRMVTAILLALFMELLGGSLTGLIVISFITIYYFLGDRMLRIRKINPKVYFFIAIAVFVFMTSFITIGRYTNLLALVFQGNITFSNRTRIWILVEDLIRSHPTLGIGSQTTEVMFSLIRGLNAHNQYLEIAIRGGLVALIIYVWTLWFGIQKLSQYKSFEMTSFVSICLFAAMIIGMVESETYSYAILSYFTAFAYSWNYPEEYSEEVVKRRKRVVFRLSR